jgi:MFS family permease
VTRLAAAGGVLSDIRAGIDYVLKIPWLWITILITAVSNVTFSVPFVVVLPKLVRDFYQAGPTLFGLLIGADAAGFFAASLILSFFHVKRRGMVAYSALLLSSAGLAVLGLPLPHVYAVAIAEVACICTGLGIGTYTVLTITFVQERVPEEMLGRVMSIDMAGSFLLLPIGLFGIGWLADHIGPAPIFAVGGLLSLVLAVSGLYVKSIRDLT